MKAKLNMFKRDEGGSIYTSTLTVWLGQNGEQFTTQIGTSIHNLDSMCKSGYECYRDYERHTKRQIVTEMGHYLSEIIHKELNLEED